MARLEAIQYPMGITLGGLLEDTALPPGWPVSGRACFADKLTITMKPGYPDVKVYYTVSDPGVAGTGHPASKLYEGPLAFTNCPGTFRAQCFDAAGKPFGGEYVKVFVQFPIQMTIEGTDEKFDSLGRSKGRTFKAYREKVVVKFSTPTGEKLRYRTTPPDAGRPRDLEYTGPITINKSTSFWVGKGKEGYQLVTGVGDDGYTPNLLTDPGVEVTVSHTSMGDKKLIVDGYADPNSHWNGIGQPAWVKFKLPKATKINKLELFCWWGDGRAYRYNVEVSMTGKDGQWKQIVDMKQNTKPGDGGYTHTFAPVEVQFIRINMFGNTTNDHNHLCEVRAFAAAEK